MRTDISGRRIAPIYISDGIKFLPKPGIPLVTPGNEITLVLYFDPQKANAIDAEWLIEINGMTLVEAPRLTLKVSNWITYQPVIKHTQPPAQPSIEPEEPPTATATPPASRR